jgi:hypothetical protein
VKRSLRAPERAETPARRAAAELENPIPRPDGSSIDLIAGAPAAAVSVNDSAASPAPKPVARAPDPVVTLAGPSSA